MRISPAALAHLYRGRYDAVHIGPETGVAQSQDWLLGDMDICETRVSHQHTAPRRVSQTRTSRVNRPVFERDTWCLTTPCGGSQAQQRTPRLCLFGDCMFASFTLNSKDTGAVWNWCWYKQIDAPDKWVTAFLAHACGTVTRTFELNEFLGRGLPLVFALEDCCWNTATSSVGFPHRCRARTVKTWSNKKETVRASKNGSACRFWPHLVCGQSVGHTSGPSLFVADVCNFLIFTAFSARSLCLMQTEPLRDGRAV